MTVSTAPTPNIGLGIALVDATLDADLAQLRLLQSTFTNTALVESASELTHRFVLGSDVLTDVESLMELWDEHLGHWTRYQDVAIRHTDARLRWTFPLYYARSFSSRQFDHYLRLAAYASENGNTGRIPRYGMARRMIPNGFAFTLGLAYSTTLTARRLAEFASVDLTERLAAYRALAAREAATIS